jgi:hypothetical protein
MVKVIDKKIMMISILIWREYQIEEKIMNIENTKYIITI